MMAIDLATFENLNSQNAVVAHDSSYLNLRQKALTEAAMELGVQGGLYSVSSKINEKLNEWAPMLYQLYNFNALLLPDNVLPPVIETGYNTSYIDNSQRQINLSGQVYHIVKQAHFVSNVPTWRDYLLMNYKKPEMPDKSVLPENTDEQKLWAKTIRSSWAQGIKQGVEIFKQNIRTLNRDFNGMVLYYALINRNMITSPYVSKHNKPLAISQDSMAIGNRNWQLKLIPQFQSDSSRWQPIVSEKDQEG
ncbi:type IV secretory system conjugative DNA transfer family protein [Facilibium subflavum]|uniref:type IV secretory system conjugative DNA transfer family protein n=1 Tax=Facilibium subflavum TaxID=2219058 RepID=UPI000E6554EE|nr:type IV secretory system conjugative DNA transfer family protein [Facilibium subflavum]